MLAWGAAYVPSAWLVETWPPLQRGRRAAGAGRGGPARRPARRSAAPAPAGRPGHGRVAGAHPVGALLRGDLLGDPPRGRGPRGGARQHRPAVRGGAGERACWASSSPGASGLGLLVGLVGATVVVWQGPIWPPEVSGAALIVVRGGASPGASGRWSPPAACAATANPVALAAWQMVVGGDRPAGDRVRRRGGPAAARRARDRPDPGHRDRRRRPSRSPSSTSRSRARPRPQVSTWFFLIPVVGVAERLAAARRAAHACGW